MSSDVIDVQPERTDGAALAVTDRAQAGMTEIAMLGDQEFEQRIATLKRGQERIRRVKLELMVQDVHYGTVPNTDKATLFKPGAEVLCSIYGLRASFHHETDFGDGITTPPVRIRTRCDLHVGDAGGPVVASAYGAANSWERKYRYRRGERTCPSCGTVGSVIKGKADYGGGWLCWTKKGGCGVKFDAKDPAIVQQAVGDVENPDQHDLDNTLLKMSEKRAYIGAALRGTASSDLFSQTGEDLPPVDADADRGQTAGGRQKGRRPGGSGRKGRTASAERQQGTVDGDKQRKVEVISMLTDLVRHHEGLRADASIGADKLNAKLGQLTEGAAGGAIAAIADLRSAELVARAHERVFAAWQRECPPAAQQPTGKD